MSAVILELDLLGNLDRVGGRKAFGVFLGHAPDQVLVLLEPAYHRIDERRFLGRQLPAGRQILAKRRSVIVVENKEDDDAVVVHGRKPGLPLVQNVVVESFGQIAVDVRILRGVPVAAVAADGHEVDAVGSGSDQLVDQGHLVAVAGAVRVPSAPVEESLGISRSAHVQRPSALVLEPGRVGGVNHDLPGGCLRERQR